jgi:hypothetical protein
MCLSAAIIPYCSVNMANEMLQLKVQSSFYKIIYIKDKIYNVLLKGTPIPVFP